MELSKRLQAVADMVTLGNTLVDIGTDHAYIPIYLCQAKKIPSAIAMDINEGPLERAVSNIEANNLSSYITTRLSDGVQALQVGEGESVVIAGMGGGLIQKILNQGASVLEHVKEFILQPQSELEQVRMYLYQNHYNIIEENMVYEDGKFYPMMKVIHGMMQELKKEELRYGPYLLKEKNEILKCYLEKELQVYQRIFMQLQQNESESAQKRIIEIKEEMQYIRTALTYYEM